VKIGLYGAGLGALASPATGRVGRRAEELGFESLWTGEHMVLPATGPSHRPPTHPFLDPLVALAFLAATTSRIRLGAGVLLVPQRHPVQLAKELASLDVLSNGRLLVGVGIGHVRPEMAALGVDPRTRASRMLESLAAMKSLWYDERPRFDGRWVSFDDVVAYPKPQQRPLPILFGGGAPAVLERAARHGDGWFGLGLTPEQAADGIRALRRHAEAVGRDPEILEVTVTPPRRIDAATLDDYQRVGVHRLVVACEGATVDDVEHRMVSIARELIPASG
jgi:probable F420-dependent oxidoreductase